MSGLLEGLPPEAAVRLAATFAGAAILILEDEIGEEMREALSSAGAARVDLVETGEAAVAAMAGTAYDLVILDRINPGMEGLEVLDRVRAGGLATARDVPALVHSLLGDEGNRLHGLMAREADDYVPKPASAQELVARVAAQLRRRKPAPRADEWTSAPLVVDAAARVITIHGRPLALTTRETDILIELWRERGAPLTQSMLWDRCWIGKGWSHFPDEYANTVDQAIKRLRKSLRRQCEEIPEAYHPLVVNIWAQGFALRNLAGLAA